MVIGIYYIASLAEDPIRVIILPHKIAALGTAFNIAFSQYPIIIESHLKEITILGGHETHSPELFIAPFLVADIFGVVAEESWTPDFVFIVQDGVVDIRVEIHALDSVSTTHHSPHFGGLGGVRKYAGI